MITTAGQAKAFVRKHGVVPMTRAEGRPSFVEAVAGGPVRGSWWSHPKGRLIFYLADAVTDSTEVFTLKLVDGKVTFLHKALWPALARVVTDEEWRRGRLREVSARARTFLADVERRGSCRLDPERKAAGLELERSLLVHGGSVHTETGAHATVLTAWRRVFDRPTLAKSRKLDLTDSLELLGLAAVP